MSDFELTLAGPDGDAAMRAGHTSNGARYALGESANAALVKHPLAKAEQGKPKRFDHIHLSIIDGTDFICWVGRGSDGFHHQIGRMMKLVPNTALTAGEGTKS